VVPWPGGLVAIFLGRVGRSANDVFAFAAVGLFYRHWPRRHRRLLKRGRHPVDDVDASALMLIALGLAVSAGNVPAASRPIIMAYRQPREKLWRSSKLGHRERRFWRTKYGGGIPYISNLRCRAYGMRPCTWMGYSNTEP